MTCKECIHYDRCKGLYRFERLQKAVSNGCPYFTDRSRFVELPCSLGDTVYRIKGDTIRKERILRIEICTGGIILANMNGYHIGYGDTIGKHIFLTREEAEQALKERDGNA